MPSGKRRPLVATDGVEPAVSPHGLRVAYWGLRGDTAQRDVYTIPLAGLEDGEAAVPVTDDAAVDVSPFWSPDGKTLYFGSDRGGKLQPLAGSDRREDRRDPRRARAVRFPTTWEGIFPGSFRGARSRSRIAFTAPAELHDDREGDARPGGPLSRGSSGRPPAGLGDDPGARDLARRLHARDADAGRRRNLCVLTADGSSLRQLTRDSFRNRWARWSPDGRGSSSTRTAAARTASGRSSPTAAT